MSNEIVLTHKISEHKLIKSIDQDHWTITLLKYNKEFPLNKVKTFISFHKLIPSSNTSYIRSVFSNFSDFINSKPQMPNTYFEYQFVLYKVGEKCDKCNGTSLNNKCLSLLSNIHNTKITQEEIIEIAKYNRFYDSGFRYIYDKGNWYKKIYNQSRKSVEEKQIPFLTPENLYGETFKQDPFNKFVLLKYRALKQNIYGECENCIDGVNVNEDLPKVAAVFVIDAITYYIISIQRNELNDVINFINPPKNA